MPDSSWAHCPQRSDIQTTLKLVEAQTIYWRRLYHMVVQGSPIPSTYISILYNITSVFLLVCLRGLKPRGPDKGVSTCLHCQQIHTISMLMQSKLTGCRCQHVSRVASTEIASSAANTVGAGPEACRSYHDNSRLPSEVFGIRAQTMHAGSTISKQRQKLGL